MAPPPTSPWASGPPQLPFPGVRAEFGRRAAGYLVDGLIVSVRLIVAMVTLFVAVVLPELDRPHPRFGWFVAIFLPLEAGGFRHLGPVIDVDATASLAEQHPVGP